jgi:drug/metabolite transporter (DMT)-like permease
VLGRNRKAAVTSFFALFFGAVFFIPLVVTLEATQLPQTTLAWELVAAVGIIPTTMAYMFYLTGLKSVDPTKASVFAITEPIGAAMLAFLFFGETLNYDSLVGLALIISSILLISFSEEPSDTTVNCTLAKSSRLVASNVQVSHSPEQEGRHDRGTVRGILVGCSRAPC